MRPDERMLNDFLEIQRRLKPAISIEVGAYDAQFSRYMVSIAPEVWAFEANPYVYAKNRDYTKVKYRHCAISNVSGVIDFEIQNNQDVLVPNNTILKRNDNSPKKYLQVPSRTLNELFAGKKDIALWIDCEGANEQVLTGANKILAHVDSIFTEVETHEFWKDQWLEDDVRSYLASFGFVLFSSHIQYTNQYNQIYIRKEYLMPTPQGDITTSSINKPEEVKDDLPGVQDSGDAEQPERTEESK